MYTLCSCVRAQLCLTISKLVDRSLQAPLSLGLPGKDTRWVAISSSRRAFLTLNLYPHISEHIFFTTNATWEACELNAGKLKLILKNLAFLAKRKRILAYLANGQKIILSKCSDTDMYCYFL